MNNEYYTRDVIIIWIIKSYNIIIINLNRKC
jgi:hypothetical protein